MKSTQGNVLAQRSRSAARTSFVSFEGTLCDPPLLVQKHFGESDSLEDSGQTRFWLSSSPVSHLDTQLETLRMAWMDMTRLLAQRHVAEVPEMFEMPPVPTVRVRGRVRQVYQAPFVFVDDFTDNPAEHDADQDK